MRQLIAYIVFEKLSSFKLSIESVDADKFSYNVEIYFRLETVELCNEKPKKCDSSVIANIHRIPQHPTLEIFIKQNLTVYRALRNATALRLPERTKRLVREFQLAINLECKLRFRNNVRE